MKTKVLPKLAVLIILAVFSFFSPASFAQVGGKCDVNANGVVDKIDISLINSAVGKLSSGVNDPRDADGDGKITALDARACVNQCTLAKCATPVSVPSLTGLSQAAAKTAIANAGLAVGTVTQQNSDAVPAGNVISQNPLAGTSVAAGSAIALVVSSGPAPVAAPNVVGLTQAAAQTAITGAGLSVGAVTQQNSNTVPAGNVISQNPAAGASVAVGSAIALVVSSGPAPVAAPNVVGLTQAAAQTAITGAGLSVGAVTQQNSNTVPAGNVISQNPAAGASVAVGSAIALVVSSGPAPVAAPNVVGLTQAAAQTAITGAGLSVGAVTQQNSNVVPAGNVISQNPAAGTSVAAGSAIALVVSSGPAPVAAPNVVGLTQAAAQAAITGAGLSVGAVTQQNSDAVPAGNVISQNPAAGASVAAGSAIALVVSSGPVPSNQPASLEITVSDNLVAPDGTISVTPIVKDARGTVIVDPNFQFQLSVTPVGQVTGNAPVVQGLDVTFPKLVKRLLNQNAAIDPNGDYADTDPSDSNYGKETGGTYRVTAQLVGGSLSASSDVHVLPTGTSAITVKGYKYANQLDEVLVKAMNARLDHDPTAFAEAQSVLQAINANADFSYPILNANNALAPPEGYVVTPAQLTAKGFTPGAEDAQFATALQNVAARIRAVKTQLDATNPANLTQASLDALQASVTAYKQAVDQLNSLHPSVLAITQQGSNINRQLVIEIPLLLDSIKAKTNVLMAAVANSGIAATPLTQPYLVGSISGDNSARSSLASRLLAPEAMYSSSVPVQYVDFFFTTFSIFTDLAGAARGNIIELAISLMNDIINIEAANIINANSPGGLFIDYVLGSSSFDLVCPNYMPSSIAGGGFGSDPSSLNVALIGCVDSKGIATLATLKVPSNLAAGIRLINKIKTLANSAMRDQSIAYVGTPDSIGEDPIGMGSRAAFFDNGWPRVNQGRLPCVGSVIVMNLNTGSFRAYNVTLLASCG